MLNGEQTWSIGGQPPTVDLYTITVGRLGNLLGISNNRSNSSVVSSLYAGPIDTGILSDDIDAICFLYGDGEVGPDTPPVDPRSGLSPALDDCRFCQDATICGDGTCVPLFGPRYDNVCANICAEDDDCVAPATCESDGQTGYCVVEADPTVGCEPATPANADMGSGPADMGNMSDAGADGPDIGSGGAPDPGGSDETDTAFNLDNVETQGSGCCATATGRTDGATGLLVIAGLLLLRVARRR